MKTLAIRITAGIALFGATFLGGGLALAGEGHTPVTVCHYVPAHGGRFVVIVVDDDGANGNRNLQAHAGHEHDIINPPGGDCNGEVEEDVD